MRNLSLGLLGLVVALAASAHGAEIVELALTTELAYEDADVSCASDGMGSRMRVVLEVDQGKVRKASLGREHAALAQYRKLAPEELATVRLHQDSFGRRWLEELALSDGTLAWLVYETGNLFCHPPKPIKSVASGAALFHFDTTLLGDELLIAESNRISVHGLRKDDKPFEAELKFIQRRYSGLYKGDHP